MRIEWNKVTWYSKLAALAVLIIAIILGVYLWIEYQKIQNLNNSVVLSTPEPKAIDTSNATSTAFEGVLTIPPQ